MNNKTVAELLHKNGKKILQDRFRKIIARFRDKDRTVFCIILYPESTPITELWSI